MLTVLITYAADAGGSASDVVFYDERCVTSLLSMDTVRCRCNNVTGYVAVLSRPLLVSRIRCCFCICTCTLFCCFPVLSLSVLESNFYIVSGGQL